MGFQNVSWSSCRTNLDTVGYRTRPMNGIKPGLSPLMLCKVRFGHGTTLLPSPRDDSQGVPGGLCRKCGSSQRSARTPDQSPNLRMKQVMDSGGQMDVFGSLRPKSSSSTYGESTQ